MNDVFGLDGAEFIRSSAAREKPFLLWLALTAPHTPMTPNPPERRATPVDTLAEILARLPAGHSLIPSRIYYYFVMDQDVTRPVPMSKLQSSQITCRYCEVLNLLSIG